MPICLPELEEQVDIATESWFLLALNDDVTPAELVMLAFLEIGLSLDDAKQKTSQIHNEGSAIVLRGLTKDDAIEKKKTIVQITSSGFLVGWLKPLPGLQVDIIQDF